VKYVAILILMGGLTIWGASILADRISASIDASVNKIEGARR